MIGSALALVVGFSLPAVAGTIHDTDGDGAPNVFDNCVLVPNGPNDALDQTDDDGDGFGTACDCDFTQDDFVLGDDVVSIFRLQHQLPGS
jgi:hypothetical protein